MKSLNAYDSLSEVPMNHPEVPFYCSDPGIICGNAVGDKGCLGRIGSEDCVFKRKIVSQFITKDI